MATDLTIAKEIYRQLGGPRFAVITGSGNFVGSENALTMKLASNKVKAKWLEIRLNGLDLYDMRFLSMDKEFNQVVKEERNNIYADMLQSTFTEVTGLYTRL